LIRTLLLFFVLAHDDQISFLRVCLSFFFFFFFVLFIRSMTNRKLVIFFPFASKFDMSFINTYLTCLIGIFVG
jgi:hypothetical protein